MRETFLFPFKEAIQKAGAISVMASYNEIDGIPSHANQWLLRDVLRKEWGFQGFVVSDYYAISELHYRADVRGHAVARDKKEACRQAVEAGVNIELPEPDCYLHLVELVRKGVLKEKQLDELVAPMLYWKFQMGLFDDPYVDPDEAERIVGCDEHRELARAGRARNHHPAEERERPRAARSGQAQDHRGHRTERQSHACWAATAASPSRKSRCSKASKPAWATVPKWSTAKAARSPSAAPGMQDEVTAGDPEEDRRQIAEAVKVAKKADVIVLAIGGNEQTSREAWSFVAPGRPRAAWTWSAGRKSWCKAMLATGKPVVVFLFNGRPLSIELAQHGSAGDLRVLVPGTGDGPRRGGSAVRRPSTPAASCPSPFRARPAIFRPSTTTSPPRAAAISSTT